MEHLILCLREEINQQMVLINQNITSDFDRAKTGSKTDHKGNFCSNVRNRAAL